MLLACGTAVFAASQTSPFLVEYEHGPCSAWKCGYNRKSSWKSALGCHTSSLANMRAPRLKDENFVLLRLYPCSSPGNSAQGVKSKKRCFLTAGLSHPSVEEGGGVWMLMNRQRVINCIFHPTLILLSNLPEFIIFFFFYFSIVIRHTMNKVRLSMFCTLQTITALCILFIPLHVKRNMRYPNYAFIYIYIPCITFHCFCC